MPRRELQCCRAPLPDIHQSQNKNAWTENALFPKNHSNWKRPKGCQFITFSLLFQNAAFWFHTSKKFLWPQNFSIRKIDKKFICSVPHSFHSDALLFLGATLAWVSAVHIQCSLDWNQTSGFQVSRIPRPILEWVHQCVRLRGMRLTQPVVNYAQSIHLKTPCRCTCASAAVLSMREAVSFLRILTPEIFWCNRTRIQVEAGPWCPDHKIKGPTLVYGTQLKFLRTLSGIVWWKLHDLSKTHRVKGRFLESPSVPGTVHSWRFVLRKMLLLGHAWNIHAFCLHEQICQQSQPFRGPSINFEVAKHLHTMSSVQDFFPLVWTEPRPRNNVCQAWAGLPATQVWPKVETLLKLKTFCTKVNRFKCTAETLTSGHLLFNIRIFVVKCVVWI